MKKLFTLLIFVFASTLTTASFAQDIEQIKQQAKKVCETQSAQVDEQERELVLKVCTCTVDNTDYEAFLADMAAGDMVKIQADAEIAASKCSEDKLG